MADDSLFHLPDIETPELERDPRQHFVGDWRTREEAEAGIADLQAQLEQYQQAYDQTSGSIDEIRAELYDLRNAPPPLPQAAEPTFQYTPAYEPVDLSGLPDPTTDYAGFTEGLQQILAYRDAQMAEVVGHQVGEALQGTQLEMQRDQALAEMWRAFEASYPDVTSNEVAVRGATELVLGDLIRRNPGYHPKTLMLHDPQGFMATVAERVRDAVPVYEAPSGNDDELVEAAPLPRSAGIPTGRGGNRGGGNGVLPGQMPGETPFMRELAAARKASGYY